jgi:hypothetical protein
MAESEKDRIARETADLLVTFDMALSNKRNCRVAKFNMRCARRYVEITTGDSMIHKSVVRAVNCAETAPPAPSISFLFSSSG